MRRVAALLTCLALSAGCAGVYVTQDCKVYAYTLGESGVLVECPANAEDKDVAVDGAGVSEGIVKIVIGVLQAFFKVSP
jgi:hypothetical protein